jgi:antitoxin (DNA-binding transcriptional repressor) of toxin-antitoxin stability system
LASESYGSERASFCALVEQGHTVEITDRGRPVSLLAPLPVGRPLAGMKAAGEVEPATQGFDDLPEPVVLGPETESPSSALERLRHEER